MLLSEPVQMDIPHEKDAWFKIGTVNRGSEVKS